MTGTVKLPPTDVLLVSGGDARTLLDFLSGVSVYGCRPRPDPQRVALGSSTASVISAAGYAAAEALREVCADRLRRRPAAHVYRAEAGRLRGELLHLCGFSPADDVGAVLAASGTDLHLLVGQWLRPQRIVMVAGDETGSGVVAAMHGRHFNTRAAYGGTVPAGEPVSDWRGEVVTVNPRLPDGSLRDEGAVNAECAVRVGEAAAAGRRVLLVLTDVSKTGLIVPGVSTVRELKALWPGQVEVLVDACQFRLAAETVRNYVAQDWLVALTGSKFMAGPTFSGVLLVPPPVSERYRDAVLPAAVSAYSCPADWPAGWTAARALPEAANFGLLLRWEAALAEQKSFVSLPDDRVTTFLREFAQAMRGRLAKDAGFRELPVRALSRSDFGAPGRWDREQTIFPFLIHGRERRGMARPLSRADTERVYRDLLKFPADATGRRFQLGQPVAGGQRGKVAVSALRLCVSAPMAVAACRDGREAEIIADALAALDEVGRLARRA